MKTLAFVMTKCGVSQFHILDKTVGGSENIGQIYVSACLIVPNDYDTVNSFIFTNCDFQEFAYLSEL